MPKVLQLVQKQTHKSYGIREEGRYRIAIPPLDFPNVAICHACGKEAHINTCGFCEKCWVTFAYLREPQLKGRCGI